MKISKASNQTSEKPSQPKPAKTLGPVTDLEHHLPAEWWRGIFNSLYLKTDGDVVENQANTSLDIDLLVNATGITEDNELLDVCCGQGRHSIELARRGFKFIHGIDRSRYLIRVARKRAKDNGFKVQFSEGDARYIRLPENSKDCVFLMGNSFGYFEREEDDKKVLEGVKRILKPYGKLVLDIVDGEWMAKNFEQRSWEWIDEQHFVNRERSIATDGKRIITREVITNAEIGVIADQFYAERLYTFEEISTLLEQVGFHGTELHRNVTSLSTRGQDLGMMANRLFITAICPEKQIKPKKALVKQAITVLMGDPRLPDPVKKNGKFNEEDFTTIQTLKDALTKLDDYKFDYWNNHKTLFKQLLNDPPNFVLNLCDEGYNNQANFELHLPALLEMLNIPYSGAAPGCLALCYNKAKVRAIAASVEIPVPLETYFDPCDQAAHIPSTFPALLKPALGDSSVGITQDAVVYDATQLVEYLNYLRQHFPGVPILVQEYLQGNEYSVGLVGNPGNFTVLPILEVDYSQLPNELPKILSYESKWLPESPFWQNIRYQEAQLDEEAQNRLISYSKLLFERLECRDYARMDFRCDANGTPKLLEVNPNPGWCWDGKFNLMAGFSGMTYADLLDKIIRASLERNGLRGFSKN